MSQVTVKTSDVKTSPMMTTLRSVEWVWGGVGIGAASLSACFAAYMLAFGPSEPSISGAGDFGLFARMRPSERVADSRVLPVLRGASRSGLTDGPGDNPATLTASAAIDFSPTGSLDGKPEAAEIKSAAVGGTILLGTEKLLPSFILRDVFDGRALVETPSKLTLVSKGSVIAGAGEVLAIERRGKQWAVVTSGGVIGGPR